MTGRSGPGLLTLLFFACVLPTSARAQLPGVGLSSVRAQKFGDQVPPPYAAAGFDLFASALVAGDWNGDGADDLATGIPSNDCAVDFTLPGCGAVVVRFGVPGRGLDATGATTFLTQQQAGSPDPAFVGEGFGSALAACDFNGDQIDDLAVGIPFNRVGNFRQGAVAIYLGANVGLPLVAVQVLRQGSAGVPGVGENDDRFGQALTCGDFDADGKADLAIGVPRKVVNAHTFAGQVVVLRGATGGLTATGAVALDQDSAGMLDDADAGDSFGWALASGDIDGDGFDDLAVGVPGETDNAAQPQKGAIQVIFGTAAGLTPAGNEFFTAYLIDSTPQMNYNFGRALASGDFDRDGFADLAIGVPYAGASTPSTGLVGEAFGSASGIDSEHWGYFEQQNIYHAPNEPGDYFGYTLAAGDFDGDGAADLAIGHPGEVLLVAVEGAATILMGVPGIGLQAARYRGLAAGYEGVPGPADQPDRSFALALAAGDFDGDGADDLVIGAPYEDDDGLTDVGVETVLYGALFADGFETASFAYWTATAP